MNNELGGIWKEVLLAQLEFVSRHWSEESDDLIREDKENKILKSVDRKQRR
jgi:hypothetical protein